MNIRTANLKFPPQVAELINNIDSIEFEGETLLDMINYLNKKYPSIKERLTDDDGNIRPYFNIFIGDKNIKQSDGILSKIENESCVRLLLARAGG